MVSKQYFSNATKIDIDEPPCTFFKTSLPQLGGTSPTPRFTRPPRLLQATCAAARDDLGSWPHDTATDSSQRILSDPHHRFVASHRNGLHIIYPYADARCLEDYRTPIITLIITFKFHSNSWRLLIIFVISHEALHVNLHYYPLVKYSYFPLKYKKIPHWTNHCN